MVLMLGNTFTRFIVEGGCSKLGCRTAIVSKTQEGCLYKAKRVWTQFHTTYILLNSNRRVIPVVIA